MRALVIAAIAVALLALVAIAGGGLWLNTYIHSPAFKADVESRASTTLGGPVQIDRIDFDIFSGVKLQGLVTQIDSGHAGGQGALQVQVARVNCGYSWSELIHRRLKLTALTLDQPQIVLTKEPTAQMTSSPGSPAPAASNDSAAEQSSGSSLPFQFLLDRVKISDGTLSIRDAAGTSLVELKGVNAEANTSGYADGQDVTGTLRIADMAASNIHVTNFSTPVSYGPSSLQAKPFTASAFGGNIAGDYQLAGAGPSILNLNGNGFDVGQLTAATASGSSAKLTGSLDLQSKWRSAETGDLNGEGDAQLTGGKLEGVKILQDIGTLLRVNELTAPIIITKAQTHFLVQNRQTQFNGLQIESPLFHMTGNGTIGFDGALNADLVLVLNRDVMSRLPSQAAGSFVQAPDGSGSISFRAWGTTADPQTDLPSRLLMQNTQIKNVINKVLNKLFH